MHEGKPFFCVLVPPPHTHTHSPLRIWYIPHEAVNGNLAPTAHPVLCGGFGNMGINCCQDNKQHHSHTHTHTHIH